MALLTYQALFHVTCREHPPLVLVGVCTYDLYITQERVAGLHRELVQRVNSNAERFNIPLVCRGVNNVLHFDVSFDPIDISEMSVPDPNAAYVARVPKSVNTCINICMKDVHQVLYPLTKPVGC